MDSTVSLQNSSVEVLPYNPPQNVTLTGDGSLKRRLRLNEVIWVGPNPVCLVSS